MSVVNELLADLVLFMELMIVELIIVKIDPPVPRWYLIGTMVAFNV